MDEVAGGPVLDEGFARELVERARAEGVNLVGPGGLLGGLTKQVLETALEAEMSEHLGSNVNDPVGRNGENSRNGVGTKTVITEVGSTSIDVPRDRDGTFAPVIVAKRQRRLTGADNVVLSLTAKGLTSGEIAAHFAEIYDTRISKETISRITDSVIEAMTDWQNRPLDRVYPVVFIAAIHVKIRDGQVASRPIYAAIGVTVDGERDNLGLWVGTGGEGAKFWLQVLTEIKNRGVEDVLIVVCDGLKGFPETVSATWPLAIVQTCVLHLIRTRSVSPAGKIGTRFLKRYGRSLALRPKAQHANDSSSSPLSGAPIPGDHPAVRVRLGRVCPVPSVLTRDPPHRLLDEAIESLNARLRRAVRARGHFPNEQAALKCLYMTVRSLYPTGKGRARWVVRWQPALNTFALAFEGRIN